MTHYKKKEAIVGLQPKANTRLVNNNGDLEFNHPLKTVVFDIYLICIKIKTDSNQCN